jgi:hypothetical protein
MGRPPLFKIRMTNAEKQKRYRQTLQPPKKKRRLSPGGNAPTADLIMTPPELATAIVDHFRPSGIVLDPCRGQGAFFNALGLSDGVTEVRWCELNEDRDTNPPWSKLRAFLNHAMTISDNVVYLATMTHFVTRARRSMIERRNGSRRTGGGSDCSTQEDMDVATCDHSRSGSHTSAGRA